MWMPYGGRRYAAPVADAPAVSLHDVTAAYPGAASTVLRDITLEVPIGDHVALIGPNGSGKSSLLKVLAGLLRPSAGTVRIHGLGVGVCHHRVAYLSQRNAIDWRFPVTLRELVMAGRFVHLGWLRRPGAADEAAVARVLDRLDLTHLAARQISELSGGQQQRALLGRTLVQEADLLLLDEPFTAIDGESRATIESVLRELHQAGKTIVVVTHDTERLAGVFERVVELRDGCIVADRPADLHALEVVW